MEIKSKTPKTEQLTFTTRKAWLVDSWSTEAKEGIAFNILMTDWGSDIEKVMFSENGLVFKEYSTSVIYDKEYTMKRALLRERESYADYCDRQVKEYQEKAKKARQ